MIKSKIVIVMPAYNAARTIKDTYKEIPSQCKNIILVDDHSKDDTIAVSKIRITVFEHPNSRLRWKPKDVLLGGLKLNRMLL